MDINKYKKIIVVIGILFVGYNIFDKFYYPNLTNKDNPTQNQIIVVYQYWSELKHNRYNEKEAKEFVARQILKKTADQRLVDVYMDMKKDQNIKITKNKLDNSIYIFTNSHKYLSELTVYRDDGTDLIKEKIIYILHPYKVGFGTYDEENHKIYLGVIRTCLHEGNFLGDWINGSSVVDEKDCYVVDFERK